MIRIQLYAPRYYRENRTWLTQESQANSATLWTSYCSTLAWRITEDGEGCHHLPPTSTNCVVKPHQATHDQLRPHACMDKQYSSTPRGAPTLQIDRHCTRANIRILVNRYRGTIFTRIIMQGVWYTYKLSKEHTSDKAEYEPHIHKDTEDNSIRDIRELQR
jgi:hypothetical protein